MEGVGGYRCQCPAGYMGPECQLVEVGVLEGGHVAVSSPSLKHNSISFKIRTRSRNGLLLYAGRSVFNDILGWHKLVSRIRFSNL